jgi:hypothetical protein
MFAFHPPRLALFLPVTLAINLITLRVLDRDRPRQRSNPCAPLVGEQYSITPAPQCSMLTAHENILGAAVVFHSCPNRRKKVNDDISKCIPTPIIVVRKPDRVHRRRPPGWTPQGIDLFSVLCVHVACSFALFCAWNIRHTYQRCLQFAFLNVIVTTPLPCLFCKR